jgi:ribosome-associated protein
MEKITIRDQTIRLGQFLKLASAVSTGGEAKARIQAGEVLVNGAVELRRGAQLKSGDRVEIDGRTFQVG